MEKLELNKPNIFMRFVLNSGEKDKEEQSMFVYSNINGLKHLEEVIKDSLFSDLLKPLDIIDKLTKAISKKFAANQYNGIESEYWLGNLVMPFSTNGANFELEYKIWKNKAEEIFGKENIFEVKIPHTLFEDYLDSIQGGNPTPKNQNVINYVESYRLKLELSQELNTNKLHKKNPKV
jgi:hypothetical protein